MNGSSRLLVVRIGRETVALPASRVRCVSRRPAVSYQVSVASGALVRLACVHGDPVVIRSAFDVLRGVEAASNGPWLIVGSGDQLPAVSFAVDEVLGLRAASDASVATTTVINEWLDG